jgi:putative transposase
VPRRGRIEAPGAIHHVVAQGNNRGAVALDDIDRVSLLRRLAREVSRHAWRCHAYCLMDTHLHALVETPEPNLGPGIGRLLGGHAHWFNGRHSREGHVFTSSFYSQPIQRDEHFVAASVYVVVNPVAAGLCTHPADWRWSSYAASAGDVESFVSTDLLLGMLARDHDQARARYRRLVEEAVAHALAERRGSR